MFKNFFRNSSGATAIEYALIAMFISVATIGGIKALGEANKTQMDTVASKMPGSS